MTQRESELQANTHAKYMFWLSVTPKKSKVKMQHLWQRGASTTARLNTSQTLISHQRHPGNYLEITSKSPRNHFVSQRGKTKEICGCPAPRCHKCCIFPRSG